MSATTTATPAEVREIKTEGQALGARAAREAHREAFRSAVRRVPVGEWFTVNDLRPDLDAAQIPPTARGPLMAMAAREGLAEVAQYMDPLGRVYELQEQSSGRSAKGARVSVYVRLGPEAGGPP